MKKNKTLKYILIIIFLILIISLCIFEKYHNGLTLVQLKNNTHRQMMGYVLKTKNKTIVIDGGLSENTQDLIGYINKIGGGKIDYWFITHPHADHATAFLDIVENTNINIGKIYITLNDLDWYKQYEPQRIEEIERFFNVIQNSRIKDNVEEVTQNQKIKIDNLNCEILGVKNPEIKTNAVNNSSMVIKMKINDKSILFLGDTGKESGEKLLQNQKNNLKSDIVQMAHHGQSGADKDLYELIKPKICLWPTPDWLWDNDSGEGYNTGSWETLETREWMKELNVKTNYIEKDGNISFRVW